MKKRVAVAMSGGVDSAVAAALLKEKGCEVIGLTMCFGLSSKERRKPGCCSLSSIDDARRVAHKLGIKHYVLNMRRQLEKYVIRDFSSQYLCGKTPNPCIICNQHIKFGELMKKADALGASYLATGHYCRVSSFGRIFRLKKARDLKKDQSYFLYRLNQAQLSRVVFPLGEYTKDEVRKLAREFSLPVADKIASQEICFLPEDDYRKFLKERLGSKIKPGIVVDRDGKEVGKHKGLAYYTIGQREGLRIALGYPAYIIALDYQDNRIIVGRKEDAFSREFLAGDLSFSAGALKKRVVLQVKIRYNHKESQAQLKPSGNKIRVIFKERQFAVTPGQAAVFYNRGAVIGGGVIEEVLS